MPLQLQFDRSLRRLCFLGLACGGALLLTLMLTPGAAAKRAPRKGGHVSVAWPKTKRGKPNKALARYLARQVGGRRVHKNSNRATARATTSAARATTSAAVTAIKLPLRLVRSFDIPAKDPAYERLLNLSFTYDSALAATAFVATKNRTQAEQVLDQLAALQRTDGSIDYSFNSLTGASNASFRTGTIAWLGHAAESYRTTYKSSRYAKVSDGVKNWLLAQQMTNGLIAGAPGATWASTQHNLVAYFFLRAYAANNSNKAGDAANRLAAGIESLLLFNDGTGLHFRQGLNDPTAALDAQTLGIFYLLLRGRSSDAGKVADWMNANLAVANRSIALSSAPATFNLTYSSPGPFSGYRPYAGTGAPDVLWMEGTLEARLALAALGRSTTVLDDSIARWRKVAGTAVGPLMADRTITDNAFNEYHVWPVSSTASWFLLSGTGFKL